MSNEGTETRLSLSLSLGLHVRLIFLNFYCFMKSRWTLAGVCVYWSKNKGSCKGNAASAKAACVSPVFPSPNNGIRHRM